MIDVTSAIELKKLDTYTKGHVNFRKEDYYVLSNCERNLYFDKDDDTLRFVFYDRIIYDVKNKFFEEIGAEGIVVKDDDWEDNYITSCGIYYTGSACEKVNTIALDALQNNFLSDKNDDKYRVIVSKSGSIIKVYKKSGDFVCCLQKYSEKFEIYNLFAGRTFPVSKENGGELHNFLYKYFEKCSLLLSNDLLKTLAK